MITRQGKQELSTSDQKAIKDIIAIGPDQISSEARAHLNARRSYLTDDIIEQFGLGEVKTPAPEENANGGTSEGEKKNNYKKLKKEDLLKECEGRGIKLEGNETNADLIEILEADDRGELEEVEE